jgi:hypothetical protein
MTIDDIGSKMKFLRFMAVSTLMLSLLHGCATEEADNAYYVNEMGEVSIATDDLTSELQRVAGGMVNVMAPTVRSGKNMRHPSRWPAGARPLTVIVEVDNRTGEYVDSRRVAEAIRAALRSHGAFWVLDGELPLPDARRFALKREAPSSAPDTDKPVPVDAFTPAASSDRTQAVEPRSQKRARILRFLETRLKEPGGGAQGDAPIYLVETALLPLADPPSGDDGKKEPYLFRMFVEEIRSETIKWANAWEVRKAASVSNIVESSGRNSYRAPVAPGSGQNAEPDASRSLDSDLSDTAKTLRNIGEIRNAIQK